MIAQSLRFSKHFSSLFDGLFLADWDEYELSVTVILILLWPLDVAYLFSLLSMGDGVTRKSLKDVHMLEAKTGNFTANFPIAWRKKKINA